MVGTSHKRGRPYQRVAGDMRAKIHNGFWRVGSMLPGRKSLAETYGVTTNTIDSAVALLISEGLLRVEDRRGTFVNHALADQRQSPSGRKTCHTSAGKTHHRQATIGIVASVQPPSLKYFDNQWPLRILTGCEQKLAEDESLTLAFVNRVQATSALSTVDAIASMEGKGIDALVLIFPENLSPRVLLPAIEKLQVPAVIVGTEELTLPVPYVYYANTYDGYQAAYHLLQRGYRRFVLLNPFTASWVTEREIGCRMAIEQAGLPQSACSSIPAQPRPIPENVNYREAGHEEALALFATSSPPFAIIASNDYVACGVLEAAEERGLVAGVDFGLIGFDDYPAAREVDLTSLRPPLEMMGQEAARIVRQSLSGHPLTMRTCLRSHLIPRHTTAPIVARES